MIFYGMNVAAFKLPIVVPHREIVRECVQLSAVAIPHNLQLGKDQWETISIKGALGNWRLTDPPFYRDLPEFASTSGARREERREYMKLWGYTELACHAPVTTEFCQSVENLGAFMTGARFLKVPAQSFVKWHQDNNPHKEFRVTVGLSGMEHESFTIQTGKNRFETIPMKVGEAWFVDIGLGHEVRNTHHVGNRYRLGLQYYSPTTDRMLDLFDRSTAVIYAEQIEVNAPLEE